MIKSLSILLVYAGILIPSTIDKSSFYKAFESDSKAIIDKQLEGLSKLKASTSKDAYVGALTMKQSQFFKTPKEKISVFKKGATLLEGAIKKSPKNGEYRFLRLAIQENAPKLLKYTDNIDEDLKVIYTSFSSFSPVLKKIIRDYSQQSAYLKSNRLN